MDLHYQHRIILARSTAGSSAQPQQLQRFDYTNSGPTLRPQTSTRHPQVIGKGLLAISILPSQIRLCLDSFCRAPYAKPRSRSELHKPAHPCHVRVAVRWSMFQEHVSCVYCLRTRSPMEWGSRRVGLQMVIRWGFAYCSQVCFCSDLYV